MKMATPSPSVPVRKRNRGTVSCTECRRRKQKCDKKIPCTGCTERGKDSVCRYTPKPIPPYAAFTNQKLAISRIKRILSGHEVVLTLESVEDLNIAPTLGSNSDMIVFVPSPGSSDQESRDRSPPQHLLRQSPHPPTIVSGLSYAFPWDSLSGFDPFSVLPDISGSQQLPVPKQVLVRYYLERLAPWVSYLDDTLTDSAPRLGWLRDSIEHTAFFSATLLAAAVHLNRRRKLRDSGALSWFKMQTIKLVNERLGQLDAANDAMIMTVLVLLYFSVGGSNVDEYEIHLRGIHQMLKCRGGTQNLGMKGMVKNWLGICHGPWKDDWEYGQFQ